MKLCTIQYEIPGEEVILNMHNLGTPVGPNNDVSALRVRQNKEVGPSSSARQGGAPVPPKTLRSMSQPNSLVVWNVGLVDVRKVVLLGNEPFCFVGCPVQYERELWLCPSLPHEGPRGQPVDTRCRVTPR